MMAERSRKQLERDLIEAGEQWLIFKRAYLAQMGAWPRAGIDAMQRLNALLPNSCVPTQATLNKDSTHER